MILVNTIGAVALLFTSVAFATQHNVSIMDPPQKLTSTDTTILGGIEDGGIEVVQVLNKAIAGDVVRIDVTSFGGSAVLAQYIYHAMQRTRAEVHVTVPAAAMSAAALLLCHANTIDLDDNSIIMFHTLQSTVKDEKGKDVTTPLDVTDKDPGNQAFVRLTAYLMDTCQNSRVLTKQEVTDMFFKHKEIWLTGKQVMQRTGGKIHHSTQGSDNVLKSYETAGE